MVGDSVPVQITGGRLVRNLLALFHILFVSLTCTPESSELLALSLHSLTHADLACALEAWLSDDAHPGLLSDGASVDADRHRARLLVINDGAAHVESPELLLQLLQCGVQTLGKGGQEKNVAAGASCSPRNGPWTA